MSKEYNGYSANSVKELFNIGAFSNGDERDLYYTLAREGYNDPDAMHIAMCGYEYKDCGFDLSVNEYYRIGEPIEDSMGNQYQFSNNFAEGKKEDGVSVITDKWLHSMKSVFFGIDDEKIAKVGIWKVTGIQIVVGGDDEPLVYPIQWAERTNLTMDELRDMLAK